MSTFVHQPSMAAGEISPDLYGRVDQELYYIGMRTVYNFLIKKEGGAANRMGTQFIGEVKDSTKQTVLIDFKFNEEQTYVLEIGDEYLRVVSNGGQIVESNKVITAITAAEPPVVTSVAHGFLDGDDVFVQSIKGMIELNGRCFRVANKTNDTFELTDYQGNDIDATGYAAYASGGTAARIYTNVTAPWQEADLFQLNTAALNDVITVVHKNYYPHDITRTTNTNWTITPFANEGGPFQDENVTTTTVYASAVTGTGISLTASAPIFDATMEGELFYIEQEPTDDTKSWEANKPVYAGEIRRAGTNYYENADNAANLTINAATQANPCVITTTTTHGMMQNDYLFIEGVVGMTELNGRYFRVNAVPSTTTLSLKEVANSDAINSTNFTAYVSGGTLRKSKLTGTIKPEHTEGSQVDGSGGVEWEYLHSGFGIVQIDVYSSGTAVSADVINRLPDNVIGAGGATTIWRKAAWSEAQGYPFTTCHKNQRQLFGGTKQNTKAIFMSNVRARFNFGSSNPILDDEAIVAALDTGATIRHLVPLKTLVCLSDQTEETIVGTEKSFLATEPPTAEVQGATGSSTVPPIIIGTTAIFVQDVGRTIHSLKYTFDSDSYGGIDLTARSSHLFKTSTVKDWAYQRIPYSVVWTVMNDGNLLGFTFMEEQKVYAWHRHETDGIFESVATVREGDETATYFVVKRTINGVTKRYIERFASREFTEERDAYFVDCGLTYDGRNTGLTTITVSGGTTWASADAEDLTLTASASIFTQLDVDINNEIAFWYTTTVNGEEVDIRLPFRLTGYTNGTTVTAIALKDVPVSYRTTARTDWEFAKKRFYNFDHIEGKDVSCLADGNVVPNLTVENGMVEIPDAAAVVHTGIGYISQLETLDMSSPQAQSKAQVLTIPAVHLTVQETVSINVGTNGFGSVVPTPARPPQIGYDAPVPADTYLATVTTNSGWSRQGRICIQNDTPTPITINCITPEIELGDN